jgi:RNA polymerase subunit RPABC4/transcription elongation factor Spt4
MEYCANCGNVIQPGELSCRRCGTAVSVAQDNFHRCSNGHVVPEGVQFCPWCGEAVKLNASLSDPGGGARKTVQLEAPQSKRTVIFRQGAEKDPTEGLASLTGFLVSYTLSKQGKFFPLREGRQTIGKGLSARIKIDDERLSDEHGVILFRGGVFIYEDRLSSNGSIINGQDVLGQITLVHGDILRLGSHDYILVVIPTIQYI